MTSLYWMWWHVRVPASVEARVSAGDMTLLRTLHLTCMLAGIYAGFASHELLTPTGM